MRIYQRGRVWYLDYSFNGKRVRKKIGTSKEDAELVLHLKKLKLTKSDTEKATTTEKVLFEKLCEDYLDFSQAHKAPQSYRRDQTSIKNLLKIFKGIAITDITIRSVELYMNKRRKEIKPATVNRELSCIKHIFTKAIHWQMLKENPLRHVKRFKEPPGRIRYLTDEEIGKLLNCCAKYLKPIVIMALNTGMRKGEILNLKWSDVDMQNRVIKITNSKNNESRGVPINDLLSTTLLELKRHENNNDSYVFTKKNGTPRKYIHNGFYNAMKRAGITNFRFHDCRHTFASHLAMKGIDIRVIQRLLGHKTILMTMRYSHLSDEALRAAVDNLNLGGYNEPVPKYGTKWHKEEMGVPAKR